MDTMSVPMNSTMADHGVLTRPIDLTIWYVATWVVTPGTSAATRNRPRTRRLKGNVKRLIAYAARVPTATVPVSDTARMTVVFQNPRSMFPPVQAVAKLWKLSQFRGGVSGPVVV